MPIDLPQYEKKCLLASLRSHVQTHLDLDIGLLQAERLYETMMELVGATIYNHAIVDAQAYLQSRLLDMEADLHKTVEHEP